MPLRITPPENIQMVTNIFGDKYNLTLCSVF